MTELEKIEYAKSFLDKLANGIDPTDNSPIPNGDVASKARVVGCYKYVSDVLGTLIANPAIANDLCKTSEWNVTPGVLSAIECSRSYVSITKFAQRIDASLQSKRKFTAHVINPWLCANGYLEQVAVRESNQVGFDEQIFSIPLSFPLDILPICPAGKAFGLKKICCVKTARTRERMHF